MAQNGFYFVGDSADDIFAPEKSALPMPVFAFGNAGNDTLTGGDADDVLVGGSGNDTLDGKEGNNILVGGSGDDTIEAGDGNNIVFDVSGVNDVTLGGGNNLVVANVSDTVVAGDGNNMIIGGSFDVVGSGDNTIIAGLLAPSTVYLGYHQETGSWTDEKTGEVNTYTYYAGSATAGDNTVLVGPAGATVIGGVGNDTIMGSGGNYDYFYGGDGNDILVAGPGTTTLVGGRGADLMLGGANTTFWASGGDTVFGRDGGTVNFDQDDRAAIVNIGGDVARMTFDFSDLGPTVDDGKGTVVEGVQKGTISFVDGVLHIDDDTTGVHLAFNGLDIRSQSELDLAVNTGHVVMSHTFHYAT